MKSRIGQFLPIIAAEMTVCEKDSKIIKEIFEKTFLIVVPIENNSVEFYSDFINNEIEICKYHLHVKMADLKGHENKIKCLDEQHYKLNSYKDLVLFKLGASERYNTTLTETEVTGTSIYKIIYIALDKYLCYIETLYGDNLSILNDISADYYHNTLNNLFDKVQWLHKQLYASKVDRELISMIEYPLECLADIEKGERIKLHDVRYYQKFVNVLTDLMEEKKEKISDKDIIYSLYFLNFNTIRFYDYAIKYIRRTINVATSIKSKKVILHNFLNETKCGQMRSQPFLLNRDCIKKSLFDFCMAEIECFEAAESLDAELNTVLRSAMIKECQIEEEVQFEGEDEKLDSQLSVEEICHIFKGMKEVGIIENKHTSQIFRVVSRFMRSLKSPNISEHSLKKKWKAEISDKARKKLIDYFQKLIKYLSDLPLAPE